MYYCKPISYLDNFWVPKDKYLYYQGFLQVSTSCVADNDNNYITTYKQLSTISPFGIDDNKVRKIF